jgi:hypothetical protein
MDSLIPTRKPEADAYCQDTQLRPQTGQHMHNGNAIFFTLIFLLKK